MRQLLSILPLILSATAAMAATTRLSETSAAQADGSNLSVKVSDDGRFAVFTTNATNLIANDTNTVSDIVLKDRQTGALTCMSCDGVGAVGNAASSSPAISGDGRFVTFQSTATNLVAGDSNGVGDVFVREVSTGTMEIVSRAAGAAGAQGLAVSGQARLSSTGRFVVFATSSSNLVANDTNGSSDVFVRDRSDNSITRASVATGGGQASGGGGGAIFAAISGDGRYVVFTSGQQTLAPGDSNNLADAFLHDRQSVTTERLSNTVGTTGSCADPAISADGSLLAFSSTFADLVPGDTNSARDTFIRARTGTTLTRIAPPADEANGALEAPSINGTGSKVAFFSAATNLVANDLNAVNDVFLLTVASGAISRVSAGEAAEANGSSTFPWIAGNTDAIVYSSNASNLIANDTNGSTDTFATVLETDVQFANGFE